jgi:hypothetical protein
VAQATVQAEGGHNRAGYNLHSPWPWPHRGWSSQTHPPRWV